MANVDTDDIVSAIVLLASSATSETVKKSILLHSSPALLRKLTEIVREVLFGEVEIGEVERRALARHKARVHRLAAAQKSPVLQRRFYAQKASLRVLAQLLSAALPSLSSHTTTTPAPDYDQASSHTPRPDEPDYHQD